MDKKNRYKDLREFVEDSTAKVEPSSYDKLLRDYLAKSGLRLSTGGRALNLKDYTVGVDIGTGNDITVPQGKVEIGSDTPIDTCSKSILCSGM